MTLYEIGQIFYIYSKKRKNEKMEELQMMYTNAQLQMLAIGCALSGKAYPNFDEIFEDLIIEDMSEEELQIREAEKLDSMFGLYASAVNAKRREEK